jgi:hypothetical protein
VIKVNQANEVNAVFEVHQAKKVKTVFQVSQALQGSQAIPVQKVDLV